VSVAEETAAQPALRGRSGVVSEITAAASILTRLPVSSVGDRVGGGAFGLVGALVGAAGGIVVVALGGIAPAVAAIGAVSVMAALSGALHFDGLADTADALLAPTDEAAERARSDPRAGPAAVVAVVVILVADWSLIGTLVPRIGVGATAGALVIAGATSRAAAVLAPLIDEDRFRAGFGSWFAELVTARDGVVAAATAIALAGTFAIAIASAGLAVAGIAGLAGGFLWGRGLARIRHGLDGDALGAIVELTFTTVLLAALLAA
jgi:adenosylcobinamide-GDP ribazoletransferase